MPRPSIPIDDAAERCRAVGHAHAPFPGVSCHQYHDVNGEREVNRRSKRLARFTRVPRNAEKRPRQKRQVIMPGIVRGAKLISLSDVL